MQSMCRAKDSSESFGAKKSSPICRRVECNVKLFPILASSPPESPYGIHFIHGRRHDVAVVQFESEFHFTLTVKPCRSPWTSVVKTRSSFGFHRRLKQTRKR